MSYESDIRVFDRLHAMNISEARKKFLSRFMLKLINDHEFKTAVDVGCGLGFFSEYLSGLGLKVTALDGRSENIAEARRRHPALRFETGNIEDPAIIHVGHYDISLCFGLLYHLENPFLALRNLAAITRGLLVLETRVAPFKMPAAVLVDEQHDQDQALNYCAFVASERCVLKMLYKSGFSYVYRPKYFPEHKEFSASLIRNRMRTVLVASKKKLQIPFFRLLHEPLIENNNIWWKFGIGSVVKYAKRFILDVLSARNGAKDSGGT